MLSILELPTVRRQAMPIDLRTYHWMGEQGLIEERTELIRGVIIEKMSKSPLHEYVIAALLELAQACAGAEWMVRKEGPLSLADSEPEPDISIVAGQKSDFRRSHPTTAQLVIEVAVSSVELDREKAFIYAEAGVSEYWLVIPEQKTLEIFTQPASGSYAEHRVLGLADSATSAAFPGLVVQLGELFS